VAGRAVLPLVLKGQAQSLRGLPKWSPQMVDWDTRQYLRFEKERTQACIDLVHRIDLSAPRTIVDLGCGPGNSTAVLKARWPAARITGVDNSSEMLERARSSDPSVEWVAADIGDWHPREPADLVFSNAALQWLPDHFGLISRLWSMVASGGALAFQLPAPGNQRTRWLGALESLLEEPSWNRLIAGDRAQENVLSPSEYYDLLGKEALRVELWDTEYCHVLPDATAVVEWVKGTALRPILSQFSREEDRNQFLSAYAEEIRRAYPPQKNGHVLFPFLRRFLIAYRA